MQTSVLVTAAGRRIELIQCLRSSFHAIGGPGRVIAADASPDVPAAARADAFELVPPVDEAGFASQLREIVEYHSVQLLVPTIDTELLVLAQAASYLREAGAHSLVSGVETIMIGGDKVRTHAFLREAGIPCPRQWSAGAAFEGADDLPYPVVIKPIRGSSSLGVSVVDNPDELRRRVKDGDVVQSRARGDEYTVDVWVDRVGDVRSVVPRRRIEVRGGEVSKSITERNEAVIDLARRVAEALPDPYGPLTIQIFADEDGTAEVIEINPRFGGGYPLSWEAGARTTAWALQDALDQPMDPARFVWEDRLLMLRYDQSVFVQNQNLPR